jgi:hypothetical protein
MIIIFLTLSTGMSFLIRRFGNSVSFRLPVAGEESSYFAGPGATIDHWLTSVEVIQLNINLPPLLPDDGNRSSFRNIGVGKKNLYDDGRR